MAEDALTDGVHRLRIVVGEKVLVPEIQQGWRSLYYLAREESPVAILPLTAPAVITTTYEWV